MNINMKYYIVTIGAIFIALGVGILVGFNLNYDQALSKQQSEVLESFNTEFEALKDKNKTLQSQINDLVYQKEELESDNNNMQFILNNEVVDYYRANELFDEIKYNQIEILKIDQKLAKLKAKYDKLTQSTYQR